MNHTAGAHLLADRIPAVCISLDRRPDRWTVFQKEATAANLTVDRLSAVDAKNFDAITHPAVSVGTAHNIYFKTRRGHHEIDRPGAVGCSLSHFAAWERLRASSDPALIIFEDDARIPVDFKERLQEVLDEIPAEWDVINFQKIKTGKGERPACFPWVGGGVWEVCDSVMGAYGYMISQRGAERLLARAYPIELHVDAYMGYMARLNRIIVFYHPRLIVTHADTDDSDINHGDRSILNLPNDMEERGIQPLKRQEIVAITAMSAIVGGALALAFIPRR
jgi:glycosyl transferase family 25